MAVENGMWEAVSLEAPLSEPSVWGRAVLHHFVGFSQC